MSLELDHLLDSSAGAAAFEAQLQREYSEENLAFWQAVRDYRDDPSAASRLGKAQDLKTEFVVEGSMRQVNLPSKVAKELLQALDGCKDGAPVDLFDAASAEIFKLMERDTFSRFKNDPEAIGKLVDNYYTKCGVEPGAEITFKKFKEWGLSEPTILIFFTALCTSVQNLMRDTRGPR